MFIVNSPTRFFPTKINFYNYVIISTKISFQFRSLRPFGGGHSRGKPERLAEGVYALIASAQHSLGHLDPHRGAIFDRRHSKLRAEQPTELRCAYEIPAAYNGRRRLQNLVRLEAVYITFRLFHPP